MNTAVATGLSDLAIIQGRSFYFLFLCFDGREACFSKPYAIVFLEVSVSVFDMFFVEAYC
jgi:hypothetical protein